MSAPPLKNNSMAKRVNHEYTFKRRPSAIIRTRDITIVSLFFLRAVCTIKDNKGNSDNKTNKFIIEQVRL